MGATGWPCRSWPVKLIINEWPGNNISKKNAKEMQKKDLVMVLVLVNGHIVCRRGRIEGGSRHPE